jgi:tellurite resistance protein
MLLGAALYPYAVVAGQVIVGVFAAITVLVGGLLTGQWIAADLDSGDVHPGYFLPTVAGAFVAAATVAQVGFRSAAWAAFGIGVICWLLLGSLLLNRCSFGPSFWAFTFPYAATASYALDWLNLKRPVGYQAYAVIVLALITGFIGIVAVRSLILLARRRFLPPRLKPARAG